MATPVYGESSSTGGGTQYRYISATYMRQGVAGPTFGYLCNTAYGRGYVGVQAGSLVSVSFKGAASPASTTNIVIYKNNSSWFTAVTGLSLPTSDVVATANYAVGTNTYAANDYIDVYLTSTSGGLYFGVTLVFAEPGP